MSEQTPLVGQRGSGGPFVTLVTGPEGPQTRAPRPVVYGMALAQFGLFVALLAPVTVSLALKVQTLVPESEAAAATGGVRRPRRQPGHRKAFRPHALAVGASSSVDVRRGRRIRDRPRDRRAGPQCPSRSRGLRPRPPHRKHDPRPPPHHDR